MHMISNSSLACMWSAIRAWHACGQRFEPGMHVISSLSLAPTQSATQAWHPCDQQFKPGMHVVSNFSLAHMWSAAARHAGTSKLRESGAVGHVIRCRGEPHAAAVPGSGGRPFAGRLSRPASKLPRQASPCRCSQTLCCSPTYWTALQTWRVGPSHSTCFISVVYSC